MIQSISLYWHDVYHANLLNVLSAPDREIVNHTFKVEHPLERSIVSKARGFNEEFSHLMFDWMINGGYVVSPEMLEMNPNAKNYETIFAPLGGAFNCTAYGPRIREQLTPVIDLLLMTEGTTRRANIMILDSQDIHAGMAREMGVTKCEYPCTLGFNFRMRKGKLDMIASMRSNNYTTTVNQDFFIFTLLQEYVAKMACVPVGDYYHSAQSAHVFERDVPKALAIIEEYYENEAVPNVEWDTWQRAIQDIKYAADRS